MDEQTLLMLCIFGGAACLGWWLVSLVLRNSRGTLRRRLKGKEAPAPLSTDLSSIGTVVERVGQAAATPFMPKDREKQSAQRRQLARAGIYNPSTIRTITGFKLLLLIGGVIGGYIAGAIFGFAFLGLALGGLVGYMAPAFWLKRCVKVHQGALDRGLPDVLDLLVVCVEAGLTLDAAMQRVSAEVALAHPRLARELEMTHMETRVGVARSDALKNLGQRTGNQALQALAAMLIQAERFGTSIAQSLRIQAESLRHERQAAAEETAAKASVKLSFPVVLFIFPAILIVLAGPAAIGLFKSALFND